MVERFHWPGTSHAFNFKVSPPFDVKVDSPYLPKSWLVIRFFVGFVSVFFGEFKRKVPSPSVPLIQRAR